MLTEIGQTAAQVLHNWGELAEADPKAAGAVALSTVAGLGVSGLSWWWKRRGRSRERRSRVEMDLPTGAVVEFRLDGDGPKKSA